MTWIAALAVASAAGALLHGPWVVAGVAGGLLAAIVARRWAAPAAAVGLAAVLPPLSAAGPGAVVAALALGLVLVAHRVRQPPVLALGAVGVLLPGELAIAMPAVAAGLIVASADLRRLPWAVVPASAAVLAGLPEIPLALAGAVGAGLAARWICHHPANATMSRRLAQAGVVLLPVPAAIGVGFAAVAGEPEHVMVTYRDALGVAALGSILLFAHLGAGALVRTDVAERPVALAMLWALPGLGGGLALQKGFVVAAAVVPGMVGLAALCFGIGAALALRGLRPWPSAMAGIDRFSTGRVHNKKS